MSLPRLSVLAVVLLVALSGCNGVVDGISDGPAEQNRDTYDVDEPLDSSLPTPEPAEDPPPGLSADDVHDIRRLWTEHRERLDGRSYSARVESVGNDGNGSEVYAVEQRSHFDYDAGQHFIVEEARGNLSVAYSNQQPTDPERTAAHLPDSDAVTFEHWFESGVQYQRIEPENGSATYLDGYEISVVPGDWRLQNLLRVAENATVDRREYVGGTYYVVTAEDVDSRSEFVADEPFSLTLWVTPDGLIKHYRLEGTVRVDGDELRTVEAMSLSDINETSVERPDWYEDAVEATGDETPPEERGTDDETPTEERGADDDTPTEERDTAGGTPTENPDETPTETDTEIAV